MAAVLLGSLAPALSHALAPAGGLAYIEVCSAEGSKWVSLGGDPQPQPAAPAAAHLFEHCPFCSIHAPVLHVPPAPALLPMPVQPLREHAPAFLAAPHTLAIWLRAQPRAPPLFS